MSEVVLELKNLTKTYGGRLAVNDISLSVKAGEVFGFIGPNGAGKTTTIKMIVGLASMSHGDINVCGYSVKKDFEKAVANIGGIIENPEMYSYLTGRQNLELFAGLYKGIGKERIDEVVGLVGLQNRIGDRVKKYSLGMRQRLGIAQSLLHRPKILILDEPTNGLDPAGIHEMRDLLKMLAHGQGVAVFVSSHILSEMQLMCDRAAIIDNGRISRLINMSEVDAVEKGRMHIIGVSDAAAAATILGTVFGERDIKPENGTVKLRLNDGEQTPALRALIEGGVEVNVIMPVAVSLESEFLEATQGSVIV